MFCDIELLHNTHFLKKEKKIEVYYKTVPDSKALFGNGVISSWWSSEILMISPYYGVECSAHIQRRMEEENSQKSCIKGDLTKETSSYRVKSSNK